MSAVLRAYHTRTITDLILTRFFGRNVKELITPVNMRYDGSLTIFDADGRS